jgi:hypothetical protein
MHIWFILFAVVAGVSAAAAYTARKMKVMGDLIRALDYEKSEPVQRGFGRTGPLDY